MSAEGKKGQLKSNNSPLLIAGPCSAESEEQLRKSIFPILHKVDFVRAGIWKPRTRPGNFEGAGEDALIWMNNLRQETPFKAAIEVATPEHVELALKHNIDLLWIGARTTVNPFAVSELAAALKGTDVPVYVKNPIHPELALWKGALERLAKANIKQLGAIHRGFHTYQKTEFRNVPMWQIPMELKSEFPELPLICDPSHIGGSRVMIQSLSQKALDLNFNGLMIETHFDPDNALSDAQQQVTPARLIEIIDQLIIREAHFSGDSYKAEMEIIREQIDLADQQVLEAIAQRMKLIEQIGEIKKDNNVAIFQISRWKEILTSRPKWAKKLNLNKDFTIELLRLLHHQSVKKQTEIFDRKEEHTPKSK